MSVVVNAAHRCNINIEFLERQLDKVCAMTRLRTIWIKSEFDLNFKCTIPMYIRQDIHNYFKKYPHAFCSETVYPHPNSMRIRPSDYFAMHSRNTQSGLPASLTASQKLRCCTEHSPTTVLQCTNHAETLVKYMHFLLQDSQCMAGLNMTGLITKVKIRVGKVACRMQL